MYSCYSCWCWCYCRVFGRNASSARPIRHNNLRSLALTVIRPGPGPHAGCCVLLLQLRARASNAIEPHSPSLIYVYLIVYHVVCISIIVFINLCRLFVHTHCEGGGAVEKDIVDAPESINQNKNKGDSTPFCSLFLPFAM